MNSTQSQLKRVAQSLYRHQGNGHYYGLVKLRGSRHGPKVLREEKGDPVATLGEAKRELRAWIASIEETLPVGGKMTLAGLLEIFTKMRANKAASTRTAEAGIIDHFRAHFPKPMTALVEAATCSDIQTWLANCKRHGRTLDRWRLFAHQLFDIAESDGLVRRSPFDPKRIKRAKKDPVQRPTPTVDEFTRIVDEIRNPTRPITQGQHGGLRAFRQDDAADFAAFLGLAGVGQAEAAVVEWESVQADRIRFLRIKTRAAFYVPIYPWLRPLLAELREKAGPNPSGPIFRVRDVKHSLASACRRLGLPHFSQRALRRCLIQRLWKSGVDRKMIAKWQGHSDGGVLITSTYTEVFGSDDESYEADQLAKASGKIVAI